MDRQKVLDKISKCLRLSASCNPNEAASALRQARSLMKKYHVSDEQIQTLLVEEGAAYYGSQFNPPFWALALSDIVSRAFDCRVLIARRFGQQPEYRFIGMDCSPSIATYTFTVLCRKLEQARADFLQDNDARDEVEENSRRGDVFAQAWLFRVAAKVAAFVVNPTTRTVLNRYVKERYGDMLEFVQEPVAAEIADYEDILCGMKAAGEVALYRSMSEQACPALSVKAAI
ncbi:hypothetical protein MNBD_GAMMA24-2047 [hydrothermal vent metagenome]|uniref:Uncharacterized protein n=1 Tax=hydrothermal vent metagenome TaxID=652676 RepID=A0A3B1BNB6_9ZZZZ